MGNSFLKYIFIFIVTIILLVAFWRVISNSNKVDNSSLDQTSTINTIQKDLRFGIAQLDTINPILSHNRNVQELSKIVFEPLITLNENYKKEYCLAESVEKESDTSYKVNLRKDIKWSDDTPFSANDVKFTVDSIKRDDVNSIYKANLAAVVGLEAIDDNTVRFTLSNPVDYFEYYLTFPIMSSKYYEGTSILDGDKNVAPLGTGMFKIENRTTSYIKLVRNEEWWNSTNLPKLEGITINVYLDAGELYNAFKIGNVDMLVTENDNYAEYVGTIGFETKEFKGREYDFIAINQNNNILSRKEVRQAMNYAIDKNNIVASVFNNKCYVVNNSLDYGSWLYKDASNLSEYNLENAQKALQDNGWNLTSRQWTKIENYRTIKTSFNLFVNSSNNRRVQVAENIRAQLENFGITLNVKALNDNQYNSYLEKKNYDLIITGLNLSFSPNLATFYGNNNLANYNNEEVNKLYSSILNISDKKLLKEKIHEIQNITNDDIIYIPLYINKITLLYSSDLVGDVNPNWYNIFYNIEKWYRKN